MAHRGGSPEHVESSADAFRRAVEVGADLLECDLQLSASGDIVIYHDAVYFGAPVPGFTTDELRALIPTLLTFDELLAHVNGLAPGVRLVLDLKSRAVDRALVRYLDEKALRRRVIVTSTFAFGLWRLKRRFPDLRTGLSRGATFTRVPARHLPLARRTVGRVMTVLALAQMSAFKIETAAFQHALLDPWAVGLLQRRGLRVYGWTVDSIERARELECLGIDYLTTNQPAALFSAGRDTRPGGVATEATCGRT